MGTPPGWVPAMKMFILRPGSMYMYEAMLAPTRTGFRLTRPRRVGGRLRKSVRPQSLFPAGTWAEIKTFVQVFYC